MILVDALAQGTVKTKSETKVKYLVENMAHNKYMNHNDNAKKKEILEMDTHSDLIESHNLMASQFKAMTK